MTTELFPRVSVHELPFTRGEFYKQRDDRTLRVTSANEYRDRRVLIAADAEPISTFSGQLSLLTAANTISRFSSDIDVVIPEEDLHSDIQSRIGSLPEQCQREMEAADPFGAFAFPERSSSEPYDAALIIGQGSATADTVVSIDAAGWQARIAVNEPISEFGKRPVNPVGPGVAASYGAAEIFKAVTSDEAAEPSSYSFDAYDLRLRAGVEPYDQHRSVPDVVTLGNIQMVGAGAVGSATLYFLRHLSLHDTLTVVDPDCVDISNLNRTPLFTVHDAVHDTAKVSVVERFMSDSISTSTYEQWYSEFVHERGTGDRDVLLPVANERQVRSVIQDNYPPVMVHTTTGDWEVDVRRTIPTKDACLRCHFPPDTHNFSTACGEGESTVSGANQGGEETIQGALPFISPLAGALLTAELIKLSLDEYPTTDSHAKIGVRRPISISGPWGKRDGCGFCENVDEDLYRRIIEDTKFGSLSFERSV